MANIKYLYSSSKVFFGAVALMLFVFRSPIKCGFPIDGMESIFTLIRLIFSLQKESFDLLSGTHLE